MCVGDLVLHQTRRKSYEGRCLIHRLFAQVFDSIMNYKKEEAANLMQKLNIELKAEDRDKDGKALLKVIVA